jgi:SAM-dependent methyltransferase
MPDAADVKIPELKPNNLYLLEWMKRENRPDSRALDYGCGDGSLVFTARAAGVDAYGAETYYDGARPEDLELVRKFDPDSTFVRTITDNKLNYPDGFFNLVVANQVFEHIHDLDGTMNEIARVLKPGGMLVSLFPIKACIREPHLNVPFIHHFPKGRFRRFYYRVTRRFSRKAKAIPWGEGEAGIDKAFWFLDTHVCYRNERQVRDIFQPRFNLKFIEPHWLAYRLPKLAKLKCLPGSRAAARIFARYGAGIAMLATKK